MAYREEEEIEKANEIARTTAKKFPDFYLWKSESNRALPRFKRIGKDLELLKDKYDFRLLYPEKATFHIQEVIAFNFAVGKVFALKQNRKKKQINM